MKLRRRGVLPWVRSDRACGCHESVLGLNQPWRNELDDALGADDGRALVINEPLVRLLKTVLLIVRELHKWVLDRRPVLINEPAVRLIMEGFVEWE
jgi:hypothetical protein